MDGIFTARLASVLSCFYFFAVIALAVQDFSVKVEAVVINATVRDKSGAYVTDLHKEDFVVREDGAPQTIQFFSREDHPIGLGIVLDASESMAHKVQEVRDACMAFIKTSNPEDEVFVLSFNRQTYLHADFTRDHGELEEGLNSIFFWGDTALWNALLAAADHHREGLLERKVILAITDGENTRDPNSYARAFKALARSNLALYFVAMAEREDSPAWKQLVKLARATGGKAFLVQRPEEIEPVAVELAREIRHQYSFSYVPSLPSDGKWRKIQKGPARPEYTLGF